MNPGKQFETSMVVPPVILVDFLRIQIGQGYSNSGIFVRRLYISTFIAINVGLTIDT